MLNAFPHDDSINQHCFFDARSSTTKHERSPNANSSLNTFGYSPITLNEYLGYIESIVTTSKRPKKPFIVSVTGTAEEVATCHSLISQHAKRLSHPLLMEVNLSCPNITDKPPPAFSGHVLREYLSTIIKGTSDEEPGCAWGIKTPPYTYSGQFEALMDALLSTCENGATSPVSFITSTNTLGNCLLLVETLHPNYKPALASASGDGIGGVGGAVLHPLALGNVKIIRGMLDQHEELKHIEIIGIGGVQDFAGYERFLTVGAAAVGIGTAFGREGISVFEKIAL